MSKIQLTDTAPAILAKMSEGNPGAINVMIRMLEEGEAIDPQSAFGGLGAILALDTHRIYGSKIWMLYKDVCGQDLVKMLAVLRACQLGKLTERAMLHAIDNYGDGLDIAEILKTVKAELEEFDRASDSLANDRAMWEAARAAIAKARGDA